ncbi:TGS domain-containing protein, partial [Desemzia sp. FAM 23990]
MSEIAVKLPDGSIKKVESGATPKDIASSIAKSLEKKGLAGKWNGELVDYNQPLNEDGDLEIVTPDHENALEVLRHSTAHL